MKIEVEHLAIMMEDPVAAAAWYCKNLEMRIVKENRTSPFQHFLADSADHIMFEIHRLEDAALPDYRGSNPNVFHIAFSTTEIDALFARLILAGATEVEKVKTTATGDQFAMLRDPWGLPIQLVNRKVSLL